MAVSAGRIASVFALLLCIATGLCGTQNAFANFNMTFFWIVFVLALPYATALVGDFYAAINPWRSLVDGLETIAGISFKGRLAYPDRLGYYPALVLYLVFIWLELYGNLRPLGLSIALLCYTALTVLGAWLVGKQAWFRHAEFFAIFLSLIGRLSLRSRSWTGVARWSRTWRPLAGLVEGKADHVSLTLFILFMLSSTAVDGLHSTKPWVEVFWKDLYPFIATWFSPAPGQQYVLAAQLFYVWQWVMLLISPFLYLLVFVAVIWLCKRTGRSSEPVSSMLLRYSFSLIPLAFAYHVAHYFTVLLAQGLQVVKLASDPFGFGWNLFGTARISLDPIMIEVNVVWHAQVAMILLGHVAGIYLSHVEALKASGCAMRAAMGQLPLLILMVLFTALGLWILSLPLAST